MQLRPRRMDPLVSGFSRALSVASSSDDDEAYEYLAYFAEHLDATSPIVATIDAWARERELEVSWDFDEQPYHAVFACALVCYPTQETIDAFRAAFRPSLDRLVAI